MTSNTDRIERSVSNLHEKMDVLLERTAAQQVVTDAVKDLPSRVTALETRNKSLVWSVRTVAAAVIAGVVSLVFTK